MTFWFAEQILLFTLFCFRPNSGDCHIHPTDNESFADKTDTFPSISTAASESSSWSTIQEHINKQKEISPVNEPPPNGSPHSWDTSFTSEATPISDFPTQLLGSRTRPASYGRSSSWSESNQDIAGNTVQMYPEISSTPSTIPHFQTSWESRNPSSSK